LTVTACHWPPAGVGILRAFSSAAIRRAGARPHLEVCTGEAVQASRRGGPTADPIAHAIVTSEISSREVMQSNLDHIARFNPTLNAIVEEALASADAADAAKGGHKTGPLHGCWCRRCED
jgi:hypothetical protein